MKKRKMDKKLHLLHLLGVARPLFPPFLHESQWSFFSSLKLHNDGNGEKERAIEEKNCNGNSQKKKKGGNHVEGGEFRNQLGWDAMGLWL